METQLPIREKVIIILLLLSLVGIVQADNLNPPSSITICGYVTYANEIGIWWFNPYDADFGGVQMWLDDQYIGTTGAGDHFNNAYSSVIGTHTFSTHTFDNSGNINTTWVNLTFITEEYPGCTENWTCDTCTPPVSPLADFSANQTSGIAPLAVLFTDNSTNTPTSWNWSFGDGNYSTLQNPVHTYAFTGTFTVSLNATNSAGSNISTRSNYITVTSSIIPPAASFIGTPTTGTVPLTVQFTDTSNGSPMSWNWSFGDGNYSTLQNPSHTYFATGTYTVSLNAANSAGSNTISRVNYITVSATPPITPTSASSDSDTPRFVPSTGAATERVTRAGERLTVPFAGNLEADDSVPVVVVEISIVPSVDIQGIVVSAEKATIGPTAKISGNPPAYYLDVHINWVRENEVKEGDIRFSVDDRWLKEQGITPADLVMMRHSDNTWSERPTRMEQYSNGRYYYIATTPGFSYFAVTQKGAGAPTTNPAPTPLVTITQRIKSESTTIITTRPVTPIPVRTKTVTIITTVPPVLQAESPEFPINWIILGAAGFTGFILGIVFIHRWWIRRQNRGRRRRPYDATL